MKDESGPHEALSKLSQGQIDVLERVAQFKSSKQIARELGISWHTVDQRLKRVQAILDVSSRFDAARLYSEHAAPASDQYASPTDAENKAFSGRDDNSVYEGLVYQHSGLNELLTPRQQEPSPGHWSQSAMRSDNLLAEAQAMYFAGGEQAGGQHSWIKALLTAGNRNELSPVSRVVIIVGIAVAAILSLAMMVNLVEGLSRLF